MPNALGLLSDPRGEMRPTPRNKLAGLLADEPHFTKRNAHLQRLGQSLVGISRHC